MTLHDLLLAHGYRLVEDAWCSHGRITYIHDDEADRGFLADLTRALGSIGWKKSPVKLRSFTNDANEIEIEPGGSDVSGHFLHYLKVALPPEVAGIP